MNCQLPRCTRTNTLLPYTTLVRPPLHSACRKRERDRRCFSLPVGCLDSAFRERSTPGYAGRCRGIKCVSADRLKSASIFRTACCTHASRVLCMIRSPSLLMYVALPTRVQHGPSPSTLAATLQRVRDGAPNATKPGLYELLGDGSRCIKPA